MTWPNLRYADAEDCIEHNSANLQFLQDQLQVLQGRLSSKYKEQEALIAVANEAKVLVVRKILFTISTKNAVANFSPFFMQFRIMRHS